jgi:hypothetical protein
MYVLRDVPRKRKSLVAIEKISKGTRILFEEPIIIVPRNKPDSERLRTSIYQQVDALSDYQRRAFLSMYNIHAYENAAEKYLRIVRTNAFFIETNGSEGESSSKHATSTAPAITTHRRTGTKSLWESAFLGI